MENGTAPKLRKRSPAAAGRLSKLQEVSAPGQEGTVAYFGGTVRTDPLLTRDRPITRRFPNRLRSLSIGMPARRICGASVTFDASRE